MAPTVLRAFRNLFCLNLGLLALAWLLGFLDQALNLDWLMSLGVIFLYLGCYALPVTVGLLVAYGLSSLLIRLVDKLT